MNGWIGVDFDGTLSQYDTWVSPTHCGDPVPDMLFRVKKWLADGREVRIFTARIHPLDMLVPTDLDMQMTEREKVEARVGAEARGIDPHRYMQAIEAVLAIQDCASSTSARSCRSPTSRTTVWRFFMTTAADKSAQIPANW